MNRILFLVLAIVVTTGIQPAFARPQHEWKEATQYTVPPPVTHSAIPAAAPGEQEIPIPQETPTPRETLTPQETQETLTPRETLAQQETQETPTPQETLAQQEREIPSDAATPHSAHNNDFLRESRRLARLAEMTYRYGDFEASAIAANDAIQYAELSDDYVTELLKVKEINDAIASAKIRLEWAESTGVSKEYPEEYAEAELWYEKSVSDLSGEEWDSAYDAASKVVDLLAFMQVPEMKAPEGSTPPPTAFVRAPEVRASDTRADDRTSPAPAASVTIDGTVAPLPASYTVRSWIYYKDCLWNIAGRPWVYNDPEKWRVLYNANKSKLPDPDNPDLLEPGIVLDIPSIQGETRQGAWEAGKTYDPLR